MVDPGSVSNPKTISRVTYAELPGTILYGLASGASRGYGGARFAGRISRLISGTPTIPGSGKASFGILWKRTMRRNVPFITGITGKRISPSSSAQRPARRFSGFYPPCAEKFWRQYQFRLHRFKATSTAFLVVPTDKLAPVKYDLISDIKRNCRITDINVRDDINLIAHCRTPDGVPRPAFPAKSSVPWVQTGLTSAPSSRIPMG